MQNSHLMLTLAVRI